jgi:hypothetical protein
LIRLRPDTLGATPESPTKKGTEIIAGEALWERSGDVMHSRTRNS